MKIEFPTGKEETEQGKKLHEDLKAIKRTWIKINEDDTINVNPDLSAIKKSKVLFVGHKDEERIFTNNEWQGVPDYILEDSIGNIFVVEEKYQNKRDPHKDTQNFLNAYGGYCAENEDIINEYEKEEEKWKKSKGYFFYNHLVQIISYLKNIKEYDIKYGILIYWYYDFSNNTPYVHKVTTQKIVLNEYYNKLYNETYTQLNNLKQNKIVEFNSDNINLNKCVNCVVSNYCGHKTRKFSKLEYPYNTSNSVLYPQKFPDELRKA
jgi:hypothetical protein